MTIQFSRLRIALLGGGAMLVLAAGAHPALAADAAGPASAMTQSTVDTVVAKVRDQDLVLTLGAGNVWQAGEKVLEKLREAA